ncbi:uncharacterized protein [Panulirus ornatus]|uniref:uncharacterized protein n=1 Tax=Panulirus ornatus TaxID=150431 RepID=UPI003A85B61B
MCDQLNQSSNNELQPQACTKGFQIPACDNILTSLDSHHLPTPDLSEDDHLPQELLQDDPPTQELLREDSSTQDLLQDDLQPQDLLQEDQPPAQDLLQNDPQSQDLLQNDLPPQALLQEDFLPMCVDGHPASGVPASGIFTNPCPSFPELPHLDSLVPLQCFKSTTVEVTTALEGGATLPVLPSQQEVCVPADMTYGGSQGHHPTVVTPSPAAQVTHIRVRDKKKKCKSIYKHVPHREKPPHLVARRNARERRRVQSVNVAFARLRRVVPFTSGRSKRVSKVKTLQGAIDYIYQLQDLLEDTPPHTYNCSALHHNTEFTTTDQYKPQHKTDNHVFRNCAMSQANNDLSSRSVHGQQLRSEGAGYACRSSLSFINDHQDRQHWPNPEEGDEQQHLSECISQDILAGY